MENSSKNLLYVKNFGKFIEILNCHVYFAVRLLYMNKNESASSLKRSLLSSFCLKTLKI